MKQEINLYSLLPKPKKVILPFKQMLVYIGLLIALLLILFFGLLGRAIYLHVQVSKLAAKGEGLAGKLDKLAKLYPKAAKDQKLEDKVLTFAKELEAKQKILFVLKNNRLLNTDGFSNYLKGFSETIEPGLWLTEFSILSGGDNMEIQGSTYDPARALDYKDRLEQWPFFSNGNFVVQTVTAEQEPEKPVQFVIHWEKAADEQKTTVSQ